MHPLHLLVAVAAVSASPTTHKSAPSVSQIYQFPQKDRWFENLAVRPDGKILATELTRPNLWLIDPECKSNDNIQLVQSFPQYLGLLGIAEYRPDVFAFIAGNFSISEGFVTTPGSYAIWSVDFNNNAKIEKIANLPNAQFLNGMAYLPSDDALLLGDAGLGVVWKLNLKTKLSTIAIADPLMKKVTPDAPDGVNGLKLYGNQLWFTRGFDAIVAKIRISNQGFAISPATVVGQNSSMTWTMDDLVVNKQGETFVAIPFENLIARYDGHGAAPVVVAGNVNSTAIAEPTSLAFGRTRKGQVDESVLYVATGGAIADPVNGTITVGGQLVKIKLY